jgi:membrane peptidoglycan carboxypeptidase
MGVGLKNVIEAARELGIDAPLSETPSLALGSSEVSLLDLTGAYASVRAGIAPIEPWGIAAFTAGEEGRRFRVGPETPPRRDLTGYQGPLVGLLKLVVDRGTGKRAQLDGFAAGKTGTSQNFRDAWFVGFNEALVVGVWVGNDESKPMAEVTGGTLPATIWRAFMIEATEALRSKIDVAAAGSESSQRNEAQAAEAEPEAQRCNVRACSRFYRSFRASDCTYQPYRGRRTVCTR